MSSRLACYAFLLVTAAVPESARAESFHVAYQAAADAAPGTRTAASPGGYRLSAVEMSFLAAPEPPSLVLLASGILGLLVLTPCLRRKRPMPQQPWWFRRCVHQSSAGSSFNRR
jgi:hypothetical protein